MTGSRDKNEKNVAYERHKEQARARQAQIAAQGREVGEIPAPKNPKRREACRNDLKLFCETYLAKLFRLGWANDHLVAIKKTQHAILEGGLFALAMPRGSGKTTLFLAAVLWAVIYGHHKFALLVGANQKKARELMNNLRKILRDADYDLLLEDFPAVIIPLRKLQGIANRASGQTHNGQPTNPEWGKEVIVFATIEGCEVSGNIIQIGAIKSAVRGANVGGLRPTLCLLDDPQTKASAKSTMQTDEREELVAADVLGLAGPDGTITALMACTVIRPGDLADRFLDRKRHPDWQAERMQMLYAFPKNMELWEEYRELGIDAQNRDCSPAQVRKIKDAFYRKNMKAMNEGMDKGAVAWPDRRPNSISGLQFAMDLFFRDEAAFMAEYQNRPLARVSVRIEPVLTSDEIARRINQLGRSDVPLTAQHVTAFTDVHKDLLYWMLFWWADDFTGGTLDYGTWPDQKKLNFKLRDADPTIRMATKQRSVMPALRTALDKLADELLGRKFMRPDKVELQVGMYGVDANWGEATDTVYDFAREHARKSIIRPCHGKGIKPTGKQMSTWTVNPPDVGGFHWIEKVGKRALRYLLLDTNFWKSFAHDGLMLPFAERHSISLYKSKPHEHRLLAEHLSAESRENKDDPEKGVRGDIWTPKEGEPDNHWLDCFAGNCAMASKLGVVQRAVPIQKPTSSGRAEPRFSII